MAGFFRQGLDLPRDDSRNDEYFTDIRAQGNVLEKVPVVLRYPAGAAVCVGNQRQNFQRRLARRP